MPALARPFPPGTRVDAGSDVILLKFDREEGRVIALPAVTLTRSDAADRLSLIVTQPDGLKIEFRSVPMLGPGPLEAQAPCYSRPPAEDRPANVIRRRNAS